ncbi:hypothetical protein PGT21_000019 [Puccinia graminis f. sp. tritici]|uniref:Uncharacterized protein n=1 Tax=Puccinia graminis f. sp. tritici TaxID=56615 RepID=A0A5B0M910_PUCGR|nr:hypothetical protein PGT21_000019 [Puccinia graminis f. sp. tritici]
MAPSTNNNTQQIVSNYDAHQQAKWPRLESLSEDSSTPNKEIGEDTGGTGGLQRSDNKIAGVGDYLMRAGEDSGKSFPRSWEGKRKDQANAKATSIKNHANNFSS